MCDKCGNKIDESLGVCSFCSHINNVGGDGVVETPVAPVVETPVVPFANAAPVDVEQSVAPVVDANSSVVNNVENILSDVNVDNVVNVVDKVSNGVRIIKLIPVIAIGFLVMVFGIFGLIISLSNGSKYKGEAVATFVELVNCDEYDSESGYCDAKYVYVVNDVSYEALDSFVTEGSNAPSVVLHYNSENPSDYVFGDVGFSVGSLFLPIFGAIFFVVGILGIKNKNIKVSVGR